MGELISVIVPIYNVREYLQQCIESICRQSYHNLEIILVDDGSIDGCSEICDAYLDQDERIRVIHKENEGLVRARKDGMQAARGEYISYVDGDDWIEHNMIEKLYDTLVKQNVDIVMCGRYEDTGEMHRQVYHGIPEGRYNKQALLDEVYPNMIVNGPFFEWGIFPGVWDKLFKRICLEKYQMGVDDSITMGEDAACVYPCLLNADSIYVMHECLYHYRQTVTSMVKQNDDFEKQRNRFNVLYNSVNKTLAQFINIYDLRKQWKEYLLFLMVPRADSLYKGMEHLDFLFPFPKVSKGSKVVIYGMGTYGQRLYNYLNRTEFCKVVACVDRNYVEIQNQGYPAVTPEEIDDYDYDFIVIASSFAYIRSKIYADLIKMYPVEKVQKMDEELVKSVKTLKAFGLEDYE